MVQGGQTQADLKRKLDQLSHKIFQIDLRIQQFKQQGKLQYIPNLEAVEVKIQKRHSGCSDTIRAEEGPGQEKVTGSYLGV